MIATRPRRILVVDDDGAVVSLLIELLGPRFAVEGLTSAKAALTRVTTDDFDLVISDIEMPEMRGLELLAAIHRHKPGQLVLLMTAFGSLDLAVQTIRAGACDYVTKPFKFETLILAIERALGQRTRFLITARVIERAVALTGHDLMSPDEVRDPDGLRSNRIEPDLLAEAAARALSLAEFETDYIRRVLAASGGNVSHAARILGIDPRTLHRRLAGT